jgi:geranylgeranylglycerol-phosphate geranylgeranyltransferase
MNVSAYLRLTRPANLLIAGVSVAVGAAVCHPLSYETVWLAVVAAVLVAAGGNSVNDYFDREIDRVNKPGRPIPAGRVSPRGAMLFAGVLFLFGWGLGFRVGNAGFALISSWIVLLFLYGALLKRTGLAGNIVVSMVVASAFLLGGLSGRDPALSLIPAGLAFLFHLGREIIKDAQDMEGDARVGVRSLAVRYGREKGLFVAAVVLSILILATLVPFLTRIYGLGYLMAVIVGVDIPLLYVIRSILSGPTEKKLGMLSGLLKVDMIIGILCILLGAGVLF